MRSYHFIQLDVFTEEAFAGNPLAVFPEAEGLTDDEMMKIAREMNLSETVFVLAPEAQQTAIGKQQSAGSEPSKENSQLSSVVGQPSAVAVQPSVLRRLRIFTPTREIPFAGHPIVGTWNLLAREGVVPVPEGGTGLTRIYHEVGIGVLPVDIEFKDGVPVQVVMTQGKFEVKGEIDDAHEQAELARALGLSIEDFDETLPIQVVSTGLPFLAVPIRSLADLGRCRVNASLLADLYQRAGGTGCETFTRETVEIGEARAHARMFAPGDNIAEDPATGSAGGALGAYLVYHGATNTEAVDGRMRFVIEQGDFMHRPSRIKLDVKGEKGSIEEVKVGGSSVLVAKGEVFV
ncbi:MAG TPA: PhzF family phenazine biosynthesis protein [Pyrinomonadaceae bacterium]|nr:PhzF family phenazine biosynthesis protein [Pyrinomonadaceae bacterium]